MKSVPSQNDEQHELLFNFFHSKCHCGEYQFHKIRKINKFGQSLLNGKSAKIFAFPQPAIWKRCFIRYDLQTKTKNTKTIFSTLQFSQDSHRCNPLIQSLPYSKVSIQFWCCDFPPNINLNSKQKCQIREVWEIMMLLVLRE